MNNYGFKPALSLEGRNACYCKRNARQCLSFGGQTYGDDSRDRDVPAYPLIGIKPSIRYLLARRSSIERIT